MYIPVHTDLTGLGYSNDDNAFWEPTMHIMTYGDGQTLFNAVTSLDVIAHETGHGFTEGVIVQGQSILSSQDNFETIALNEGISDIWGAVVEHWAAPWKQTWEIGEDIMKDGYPCLRSLSNPNTGGDPHGSSTGGYPDTYNGEYWDPNGEPHTNSTVLSHWFYLLSEGGSGVNDLGNSYDVSGIGIEEAASIVWQAEIAHIDAASTYSDIRAAMTEAAGDLFDGTCSNEGIQVQEAWYAVGIGDPVIGLHHSISGTAIFCSSQTFSLNEVFPWQSVIWSADPSGIVSLTPSGNYVVNATKITAGDAVLTATLVSSCGSRKFSEPISTLPKVISIDSRQYGCNGDYEQWYLTATPNFANATNWNWTIDNPNNNDWVIHSPHSQSTWVDVKGHSGGGISVTYEDPCGETSDKEGTTIYSSCGYGPMIAPNPASNTITITANNQTPQNKNYKTLQSAKVVTNDVTSIKEVQIFNTAGALQKKQIFSGNNSQEKMSIAGLPAGIYIVKISDCKNTAQQKLVVQ